MRILLTNDDGTHAPGLAVLERIAREISDDVWVVAPETDQSGVSHSLSISEPMRLRKIDDRHFALRGTPTDCVIMGVRHILPEAPDLILSGVNAGGNLGDDVTFSGTIAGAMQGTLMGVRSFALSQEYNSDDKQSAFPWATAETHAAGVIKKLLNLKLPEGVLLNLNFPSCSPQNVKNTVVTSQGKIAHEIHIDERKDGRGLPYYWLCFNRGNAAVDEGTDIDAIRNNNISVTPLQLDLTAFSTCSLIADALK